MFLTYQVAPVFALLVSFLTFLTLRAVDPVDLNMYTPRMHGVPPVVCCLGIVCPLIVLVSYGYALKLGPQASKTGIKL